MNPERIQAVLITNKYLNVIYERYYDAFSDDFKADIRLSCAQACNPVLENAQDELEFCSTFRLL